MRKKRITQDRICLFYKLYITGDITDYDSVSFDLCSECIF